MDGIYELSEKQRKILEPLFGGKQDGLLLACLQGHMGRAFCDDLIEPQIGMACAGDFVFLAGEAKHTSSEGLIAKLKQIGAKKYWLLWGEDDGWQGVIKGLSPSLFEQFDRYAVGRDGPFDTQKLKKYAGEVPEGIALHEINQELYQMCMAEEWSRDLCSSFRDASDFAARGLGVVAVQYNHNQGQASNQIVSGASAYAVYDNGLEVQVDTRCDMRRKGLALACCAKLILACMDRGLEASWDAANMASVHLAEKLGYVCRGAYRTWGVRFEG